MEKERVEKRPKELFYAMLIGWLIVIGLSLYMLLRIKPDDAAAFLFVFSAIFLAFMGQPHPLCSLERNKGIPT